MPSALLALSVSVRPTTRRTRPPALHPVERLLRSMPELGQQVAGRATRCGRHGVAGRCGPRWRGRPRRIRSGSAPASSRVLAKIGAIFDPITTPPRRLLGTKGMSWPICHSSEFTELFRDDPVPTTSPTKATGRPAMLQTCDPTDRILDVGPVGEQREGMERDVGARPRLGGRGQIVGVDLAVDLEHGQVDGVGNGRPAGEPVGGSPTTGGRTGRAGSRLGHPDQIVEGVEDQQGVAEGSPPPGRQLCDCSSNSTRTGTL